MESAKRDTVLVACHMYRGDADEFKELCRIKALFHAEVLRSLILKWIKEQQGAKSKEDKKSDEIDLEIEDEDEIEIED